jgi:hypothetical protein
MAAFASALTASASVTSVGSASGLAARLLASRGHVLQGGLVARRQDERCALPRERQGGGPADAAGSARQHDARGGIALLPGWRSGAVGNVNNGHGLVAGAERWPDGIDLLHGAGAW